MIEDLFQAYFDARKHKRNTANAIDFEVNYERNLFKLYNEIIKGEYFPNRSICFINEYPVKREIFAADFRDRVVHHLIYNHIVQLFEDIFIHDSYSCRKGKGTLFGIKRMDHFIRSCSENYRKDCYILKLDIKGYFMSMDKGVLWDKIKRNLHRYSHKVTGIEFNLLLNLIYKTIFDNPTKKCYIKGNKKDWKGLPKDKSLFFAKKGCGLPIGNLTSQLFSNVYLNGFDHYVKYGLKCKNYGRYVDDFFIISKDKEFLKNTISEIDVYLRNFLNLKLHPKKIYLQHFSKGADFLGAYIKPFRIYLRRKNKGRLFREIESQNCLIRRKKGKISKAEKEEFIVKLNSYLGLLRHYKTQKLRKKVKNNISGYWFNYIYFTNYNKKVKMKKK